jgi:hypothetical protein
MACRDGVTAPVVVEGVQILDLADYLDMLLPQLDLIMKETAEDSHQSWKGLVGHSRGTDVAGVLPQLADSLQLQTYQRLFIALENRLVRAALHFPLLHAWREIHMTGAHGGKVHNVPRILRDCS